MRWIIRIIVLLFAIALLLAIFAPSILSTQFGKHALFRTLKSMSGYEIRSEELQLQWMKGQTAKQVEVLDRTGRSVFRADSITSTAPLWKLLFYHDVGHLQVSSPFFVIDPPQALASKLVVRQAGFSLAVSFTPSLNVLGEISISHGAAQFITPGLETISMKEVELEAALLPKQLKLQASGITEENSSQGTFQIDLLAYPGSDQIDANLKLTQFPLRAVDQLVSMLHPELKGVIRETIGESCNAELKLKNLQDTLEIYLKANSDLFSANLETAIRGNTLELASPALFQFQIPPKPFEALTDLSIKNSVAAQIKLDKLSIPLQNREQFTIQGTFKSDAFQFKDWTLEPFSLYVGSSGLAQSEWVIKIDSPQVQFHGSLNLPEKWENLSLAGEALLPQNMKVDLSVQTLKSIAITLQGDLWKGRFKGAFDPVKKTAALTEPGFVSMQLDHLPYSLPPIPIQLTIQPTIINLQSLSGSVKGTIETPAFQMANVQTSAQASAQVGAASVRFTGDLKSKAVQFSLNSTVDQGPLTADGTFTYPRNLKIKGSCSKLPVASLQPFFKEGPPLLPLLGDLLTTNFQANISESSRFLQLNTSSPNLTLKASLKDNGKRLELIESANFVWTLTPQGYSILSKWLKQSASYTLSEPAIFKGTINTLSFSSDEPFTSLEYQGKITSDALSFGAAQQINKVSQIQVNLSHPLATSPHQFQISAKAAPQGIFSCQGSWTPPGTADIKLLLEQFPSALFDFFSSPFSNFSLSTLCGPILNLSLSTTLNQWNGPLQFELHSANLRSSLKGTFNQGTLTLADTFHLQLDITQQLSQMLFKQMNPLDVTSVRSTGPVTLEIAKQGFSYPLFPSNLSKLQIGSGRLELGKLMCQNEGNIQTTLGLLKLGQYRAGDELELWFAPLDFQIQNGILNCERTELLIAKDFQVCLWGDVDFPGNSIDGILGLTASCLKNAFGIKNLPENYVLQIPIRGSLTDVKIDKGKATTKIGALILWQQKDAVGGIVKGPAGKLLGETLGKLGPLPGGDQKAPPPKKPFPWDAKGKEPAKLKKKTSQGDSQGGSEHKKLIRPEDSAIKQILKLIR